MANSQTPITNRINLIILERMYAAPDHFGIEIQKGKDPIRTLKDKKPDFYLDLFNDIFDELHPY